MLTPMDFGIPEFEERPMVNSSPPIFISPSPDQLRGDEYQHDYYNQTKMQGQLYPGFNVSLLVTNKINEKIKNKTKK